MVVDDGQDFQVFNDHDGGDLFDIGFRRGDLTSLVISFLQG